MGIGTTSPTQKLDISDDLSSGAIEIGNTPTGTAGTVRYNGTYFQGYKTGSWHRLDAGGPIGRPDKVVIVDGFIIPDVQAGLDSLPDDGGVVYVPEGSWPITTRIVVAKSNVTIRGAGPSTIIGPSTSLSVVLVNACSNVTFEDLAFGQSSTSFGRDCVEITNASNIHFENVTFMSGESGIRISGVSSGNSGLLVEACRFTGQGQAIAVTDTGFSDIQIANYIFDMDGTGLQAVYIDTGHEISITGNIFRDAAYTSAEIWMSRGINVSNNIMQEPGSYGLVFSGCSNAVVNSNTLKGNMDYGISFEDCRRAIVSSNSVGDSLNTMDFGLYITNSPQLVIEANGLEGADHGVYIFACADSRIGSNRTISTVTSDYTFDACPRSSITGNLGSTAGFYVSDSEISTISGNIGQDMDIAITDCPYSVVTGNNSGTGTFTNTGCLTCAEDNNL